MTKKDTDTEPETFQHISTAIENVMTYLKIQRLPQGHANDNQRDSDRAEHRDRQSDQKFTRKGANGI